jgi:FlaA1/EpsC-like NDP-sugar epimerase
MTKVEKNILIVGAGIAGRLLKEDIRKNHPTCRVAGFLDDQPKATKLPVLGTIDDFPDVLSKYVVDEIVVAIPSAKGELIRRVLLKNLDNRIPLKIVPRSQRVIGKWDVRYVEVKNIEPEDFLGRPFVQKDVDRLKNFYKGKVVFVTGGAGSIGSEIVRQLLDLEVKKVVVYDNSEYLTFMLEQQLHESGQRVRCDLIVGSILNATKLDYLFKTTRPDIVFHAAAYKHVHLMQDNIDEAITNNVIGTKTVTDSALKNKIPLFTFISTDKVVNPTSVMGATKKIGEYYIHSQQSTKTKFNIVRFGNVINSTGSVLPLFLRQISLHRYVTVTHKKMKRFFMSIREAAQLVLESTASGQTYTTYVLNMGELINIYEVALALIRAKNLLPGEDVEVRVTGLRGGEKLVEELHTAAERQQLTKTKDNRMFTLNGAEKCPFDIKEAIAELEEGARKNGDQEELKKTLKRLFPSLKLP